MAGPQFLWFLPLSHGKNAVALLVKKDSRLQLPPEHLLDIGTSIGVKSKSHIGVEVFVDMLPEKIYKKVRIFTEILCMLMFVLLFVLSLQMFNHLIMTKQMTTTTQIPTAVVFFCLPMGFFMGIIHYLYSIETMIKDIMHRKEEIEA